MSYFDLIFDECKKIDELVSGEFHEIAYFVSGNMSEITYGIDDNSIIFYYYPDRYEYGKIMILKDIRIKVVHDPSRQYSITQLSSFFENNCEFFSEPEVAFTRTKLMELLKYVLVQCKLDTNKDWEQRFLLYQKSKRVNWS